MIPYWPFVGLKCRSMHLANQPLSPLLLGARRFSPGQGSDPDSGESRYSAIQPNSVSSSFLILSTYSAILCRHMRLGVALVSSLVDRLCSHSSSAFTSVARTGCLTHVIGQDALLRRLDHCSRCHESGHLLSMCLSSDWSLFSHFFR